MPSPDPLLEDRLRALRLSPGRESLASSSTRSSSSSSSSSVLLLIQKWAPICFLTSGGRRRDDDQDSLKAATMPPPPPVLSWDPGLPPHGRRVGSDAGSNSGKPLRESDPAPVAAASAADLVQARTPAVVARQIRKETEFIWAYKYRPLFLQEFICNRDKAKELLELVRKQECSHFIFEGPTGVGKRTMLLAFLRGIAGADKLKTKHKLKKIELKEEHITSIDINVRVSSQHVEVNLSELRGYEKDVIVSLINESSRPSDKSMQCDASNCQAIVVHEADKLSKDAQNYILWILEKYNGRSKIFFCCYDASKLQTIKHLCKIVKLHQPSDSEIVKVLEFIAKKEQIELPHHLAEQIAKNSKNNLRQAIRSFEATWKSDQSFMDDGNILTGWEEDIANIAKSIVKEQSPKQLYIIRGKLKKLIEHDVSPDYIFNTLISELKKLVDGKLLDKIDSMYLEYKVDCGSVSKPEMPLASLDRHEDVADKFDDHHKCVVYFMKIEEFTAKFMSFYKSVVAKGFEENGCW